MWESQSWKRNWNNQERDEDVENEFMPIVKIFVNNLEFIQYASQKLKEILLVGSVCLEESSGE